MGACFAPGLPDYLTLESLKRSQDAFQAFYTSHPFFCHHLVMGLTSMRLSTFYWLSQLGMLSGTAIFVNAGSQLADIDSLSGIISGRLAPSLALIGISPLVAKRLVSAFRKKRTTDDCRMVMDAADPLDDLILEKCTHCGACQAGCPFLTRYGTPGEIAAIAFECSLCGLCTTVCPEKLDPQGWFLSLRRTAVRDGQRDLKEYSAILGYEKKGTSPLFSYYAFPKGCDTIFFPGCNLPGTRPETTWKLFQYLRQGLPSLGVVLDCCTKPSHDLGRQEYFESMFGELLDFPKGNGIKQVWVACPNCHMVFSTYARGIRVASVYEVMADSAFPDTPDQGSNPFGELAIHDPCPMRHTPGVQDSIRRLLERMNLPPGKTAFERKKTLCCGEGGSVGFVNP